MWVRVSYRGRENGWVLTANKRGPILLPAEGDAAEAFDAQEASYAAATAGKPAATTLPPDDDDDRPLTGAKPPAALGCATGEDLPLTASSKGAWVPPSEFPPGHVEEVAGAAGETGEGRGPGGSEYMTSLG